MSKAVKTILALSLALIFASGGFIGGFVVADAGQIGLPDIVTEEPAGEVGSQVDEVFDLLERQALKPPSETSATAGAIQGLLESNGDKYASYFDARHFKYFNEESMGEFGGIGVVLGENKQGDTYIVEVYEKTPADRAGMKSGDVFVAIDGVRRDKWTSDEVVKRVRGKQGTDVKLVMLRPGKKGKPGTEVKFTIERAMISYPNLRSRMIGDVGYIRMGQFNAKSADEIAETVRRFEKKGAKSFVLDLRENPGGLLDQAIAVTSLFVDSGIVVKVEERGKQPEVSRATGNAITDAPLVVLIDGHSASAAEIFGGAVQDHGRATLVGEKSFGKGSVQTIEELPDGSAVKFTIAHYLTPKGRAIDGKGLTPDVVVKMDIEKQESEKTDTQLQKALEIARKAR